MEQNQVDESIFQAVKERVGYTDEQLHIFKSHAFPHKILQNKAIEDVLRTNVVFEVVESRNCNIQHKVGDKFYFNAENQKEADSKAWKWNRYHGFADCPGYGFCIAVEVDPANVPNEGWIHNEWVN